MTNSENRGNDATKIILGMQEKAYTISPPSYVFLGVRMDIHLSGEQTDGAFSLIEAFMPPGGDGGLHIHFKEDESLHLISGELEVTIGYEKFTLKPGESSFAPRGVQHRLENKGSEEARAFLINTPGTFDPFIKMVGVPLAQVKDLPQGPPTADMIQRITDISTEFGIKMLIPPAF
jgi:mannose-6-phosphate isomerase-like protein (cupin superfamily)